MKNILIIGNGFDVAHNLNTSYKDFVKFCMCIKTYSNNYKNYGKNPGNLLEHMRSNPNMVKKIMESANLPKSIPLKFNNYLKKKGINDQKKLDFLLQCCNNFWLNYIYENESKLGKRWCDLEYQIGKFIDALSFVANNPEKLKTNEVYYNRNIDEIEKIYEKLETNDEQFHKKIIKVRDEMFDALNDLTWVLENYLGRFLNTVTKTNPIIEILPINYLLSFNYTDTYEKMYGRNLKGIHYIHGKVNIDRKREENNLVFGIGQEIKNSIEEDELDYVMFQKYYQRIIKKTGNTYKKWLINDTDNHVNVFIFGHSLDTPDGDVIKEFLKVDNLKVYIFYYDQDALNNIVINLINIFKKDILIDLTNSSTINFVKSNDIDSVKKIINYLNKQEITEVTI